MSRRQTQTADVSAAVPWNELTPCSASFADRGPPWASAVHLLCLLLRRLLLDHAEALFLKATHLWGVGMREMCSFFRFSAPHFL